MLNIAERLVIFFTTNFKPPYCGYQKTEPTFHTTEACLYRNTNCVRIAPFGTNKTIHDREIIHIMQVSIRRDSTVFNVKILNDCAQIMK